MPKIVGKESRFWRLRRVIRVIRYMRCLFRIADIFAFEGVGGCLFRQATTSASYHIVAFVVRYSRWRLLGRTDGAVAMLRYLPEKENETTSGLFVMDRRGIVRMLL